MDHCLSVWIKSSLVPDVNFALLSISQGCLQNQTTFNTQPPLRRHTAAWPAASWLRQGRGLRKREKRNQSPESLSHILIYVAYRG